MRTVRTAVVLSSLALLAAMGACNDNTSVTGPDVNRTYTQIERLGNPLTSEVFFLKRDHGCHNSTTPAQDDLVAGGCATKQKIKDFVTGVGGRPVAVGQAIADNVVFPGDYLVVYPNRDVTKAGWLSYVLQGPTVGWGGRKLSDDVVDIGLTAIFSTLLSPTNASCAPFTLPLCTDNVPASVRTFGTTFPYLEVPRV
ncbi:MAG: DUF4331 family protein [Gemmatimonadaceae bacterium]